MKVTENLRTASLITVVVELLGRGGQRKKTQQIGVVRGKTAEETRT